MYCEECKDQAHAEKEELIQQRDAAYSKLDATLLQNEAMRKAIQKVMEFWGSHEAWGDFATLNRAALAFSKVADVCREALGDSTNCTEKRKDDVMIGKVEFQGYFPPSMIHKRIVHCGGIGCGKMCTCQCEDCVAIRNF